MIMGKYVIVVESGSDVTPELCERYGIVRVPMHVTIGDETVEDGSIDPLEILFALQRVWRDAQDQWLRACGFCSRVRPHSR